MISNKERFVLTNLESRKVGNPIALKLFLFVTHVYIKREIRESTYVMYAF